MRHQSKTIRWRIVFWLLLAVTLLLVPTFLAKVKVLRAGADSIVYEVTNITPYSNYPSVAIVHGVVRNEGKVPFDRMTGELRLYRGDELLYACRTNYSGRVSAGDEAQVELTVSNLAEAEPLLAYPVKEMSYSWKLTSARFIGFGFLFSQSYSSEQMLPWMIIGWGILAMCTLAAGILACKTGKKEDRADLAKRADINRSFSDDVFPAASTGGYGMENGFSYGAAAPGASKTYEVAGDPADVVNGEAKEKHFSGSKDALNSAQKDLEHASWQAAAYRSQGLARNAETQEHFRREAFGNVLRESADLSGRDREAFDSAQRSYEQASFLESNYRASGSAANAEHAQYRRESAYAGMLKAVAEKDGRRSSDFDSAKKSYERESLLASSYRASGSSENAAEAEHRMRLAYGNMLKNSSDLSRKDAEEYSSAQRSYEYASRQAASYRRQGLTRDAERSEHYMRLEEAKMLKVKAEAKGNGRAFEDARKDYENASRRYSEYKSAGRESDANREKDYMDRAYAKMMSNT